jgi:hypothetical protein
MNLARLKEIALALGYRFETSGSEERMIRPDGSVAVIARIDNVRDKRTEEQRS